jgi:hypothetical protein
MLRRSLRLTLVSIASSALILQKIPLYICYFTTHLVNLDGMSLKWIGSNQETCCAYWNKREPIGLIQYLWKYLLLEPGAYGRKEIIFSLMMSSEMWILGR